MVWQRSEEPTADISLGQAMELLAALVTAEEIITRLAGTGVGMRPDVTTALSAIESATCRLHASIEATISDAVERGDDAGLFFEL